MLNSIKSADCNDWWHFGMEEAANRLSSARALDLCHDIDARTAEGSCRVAATSNDRKFIREAGALRMSSMSCQNERRCSHRSPIASSDVNDLSEKMCSRLRREKFFSRFSRDEWNISQGNLAQLPIGLVTIANVFVQGLRVHVAAREAVPVRISRNQSATTRF